MRPTRMAATLAVVSAAILCSAGAPASAQSGRLVRTAVHRLYNQDIGDHMYGVTADEGGQYGYTLEARDYFYLEAAPKPRHVAVYRCYGGARGESPIADRTYELGKRPSTPDHFLSTRDDCEGMTNEGTVGYAATVQLPGTVPLFRLWSPRYTDNSTR